MWVYTEQHLIHTGMAWHGCVSATGQQHSPNKLTRTIHTFSSVLPGPCKYHNEFGKSKTKTNLE